MTLKDAFSFVDCLKTGTQINSMLGTRSFRMMQSRIFLSYEIIISV